MCNFFLIMDCSHVLTSCKIKKECPRHTSRLTMFYQLLLKLVELHDFFLKWYCSFFKNVISTCQSKLELCKTLPILKVFLSVSEDFLQLYEMI